MNLKDLSIETKSVSVPFAALPGFNVTIGYMSKPVTRRLAKEATESKMDGGGNIISDFNNETFMEAFCKESVKGWEGLTYAMAAQLLLLDEDKIDDLNKEVVFSHDNALHLLKESTIFDNWINERVNDLSTFRGK
tara:strand:+ start:44 stop:448 length:405 start_codon:yes stop_codon:yes gene_type:complete